MPGAGIVLVAFKHHLYPIPDQWQSFKGNAAIRNNEIAQQQHMTSEKEKTKISSAKLGLRIETWYSICIGYVYCSAVSFQYSFEYSICVKNLV
jgi:hypothetical protein